MSDDFLSEAPVANLRKRAQLLAKLRQFFDRRGFLEVQTPVLSRNIIVDRHLDPIELIMQLPGGEPSQWFLQTSPEQSMKRLLNSGIGSIYQVGPVFRSGELGRMHNPEFTMAEWYDVGAGHEQGLALLDELLQELLETPSAQRVRFDVAFQAATGLELFATESDQLARWSVDNGLVDSTAWSYEWDEWVNLIFSERVQPTLGLKTPVLLTHFPASQAALAQISRDDARTAERFECFFQGVELANGYHELLDAEQLEARTELANQQRELSGKSRLPKQNRLFAAMRAGMPSSCGCALGFDRVVMLACGAQSLREVLAFTSERA